MRIYTLEKEQIIPIDIAKAWDFFSSPINLSKITPPDMDFDIKYISGGNKMYAGQLIRYKIQIFPGIKSDWVTEITHVNAPRYFVDEQKFGPYALWHHQHHFEEVKAGIKMTDIVNYAMPFGALGRMANGMFVSRKVNSIFNHRFKTLEKMFVV